MPRPAAIAHRNCAASVLRWSVVRRGDLMRLTASNPAADAERLLGLKVIVDGRALAGVLLEGEIPAGASRSWPMPAAPVSARSLRIEGRGDRGPIEANLPIGW